MRRRRIINTLLTMSLVWGIVPSVALPAAAVSPNIVISQVYGGGGNSGATYTHDFVELFNRGNTTVSLGGMSVQYASATGTGNFSANPITSLPATSLAPGQYLLVQLAGGANGVALPTADVVGTVNMSGTAGKVVLANTTAGLACNGSVGQPCSTAQLALIVDLVGYGGANFFETSPAPATSNTTAAIRGGGGCTETDNNSSDFTAGTPNPRNTASPIVPCGAPPGTAALVINEIDYDQPGTDAAEFLEIANVGTAAADLSGYSVELVNGNGGGAAIYNTISLPAVSLAAGDYFVICGDASTVANCDLDVTPDSNLIQNGAPDAIGLRQGTTLIDAVSYEGDTGAPYTEGSGTGLEDPGTTGSDGLGISRFPNGADTNQNNVDFSVRCITPGTANTSAVIGCIPDLAPAVASTVPANGATGVAADANVSISFSEGVDVAGSWFDISCTSSGAHTAVASGGPASYTLDPDVDFTAGESCTVTVFAAQVTDQDTQDPPDTMAADHLFSFTVASVDPCTLSYTPAYAIQGSGSSADITGPVTTQGVVVGDYEGPSPTLRGFYLQDPTGDGNAATSDAIFVFNGNNNNVSLGELVRVTGGAGEFQDQTQISGVTSIVSCGTGSVTPVDVTLPLAPATDLERFEGMLVRFPQTLYVTEHFQLGRFGQVVMSSGDRLAQPTNVVSPGAAANALQAANNLNRIIFDDDLQNQNPDPILFGREGLPLSASNTLRGGDTATNTVGVLTYTWAGNSASGNAYRLRPINALGGSVNFVAANARPAMPTDVGGTLKVASLNLLNYFNTFDGLPDTVDNCNNGVGGTAADCRGADTQAEFDRQWPKTVEAILGMNVDVLGVNEIENDGYGPDSAIADLVNKLNDEAGPGTYAFIDFDTATGQVNALGLDAIKVGLIYKPASVTPVGNTAALNSDAFVNGGDPFPRSRATFAQAFEQPNGARFVVTVNHLKSKGSPCAVPDAGDGQGNCNVVRTNAANELADWLAGDPTGTGDPDILIIGDLNSYAKEDPITALYDKGYTNLIETLVGAGAYSFVFDGQWGYLDHAMGSSSVESQVTGVTEWHINADEPGVLDYNTNFKSAGQIISLYAPDQYRVSDHDPLIVGLDLVAPEVDTPVVTPEPSVEGETVSASATFSGFNGGETCAVDYGDGSGSQAGTVSAGSCTGPDHVYTTYGSYTVSVTVTDAGGASASSSVSHTVYFDFGGFFNPITNPPALNTVKAGSSIPIRFSLGGDKGLSVIDMARSRPVDCTTLAWGSPGSEIMTPGSSGLDYDTVTGLYNYRWKTSKSWANTCRVLRLLLVDGSEHVAYFSFTK